MELSGEAPLTARLIAGDPCAFAALYDQFGPRLHRTAFAMLGSREDAEDTVHEVFLSVWKSRNRLDASQDMTAYLFTALRHAAGRNAIRRARGPRLSEMAVHEAPARPEANPSNDGDRLDEALSKLPPEQREVIAMKIDGALTFAEIARVLDISVNTAASRYRYALEKLRLSLKGRR